MNQQMNEQQSQTDRESQENSQENSESQENSTSQETGKAADGKELVDELTRLSQKFVEVIQVSWNSEQRRKIEEDMRTGLVTVASSLEDGFKRVSSSKEAQEAFKSAEDVAEKVRTSKIASEMSGALAEGLRSLSDQMDKLSREMKEKANTSQSSGQASGQASTQSTGSGTGQSNEAQDIPIARPTASDDQQ